jgi:hypothetical protein
MLHRSGAAAGCAAGWVWKEVQVLTLTLTLEPRPCVVPLMNGGVRRCSAYLTHTKVLDTTDLPITSCFQTR